MNIHGLKKKKKEFKSQLDTEIQNKDSSTKKISILESKIAHLQKLIRQKRG